MFIGPSQQRIEAETRMWQLQCDAQHRALLALATASNPPSWASRLSGRVAVSAGTALVKVGRRLSAPPATLADCR
jgi:hypothetical protein